MNFNDIYDINTPSTYELDYESSYEVLEKSFDKNDFNINFFEKKNNENIINYEYEINQQDLYCVKPVVEHKDEKDNTYNGNCISKTETKTKTVQGTVMPKWRSRLPGCTDCSESQKDSAVPFAVQRTDSAVRRYCSAVIARLYLHRRYNR